MTDQLIYLGGILVFVVTFVATWRALDWLRDWRTARAEAREAERIRNLPPPTPEELAALTTIMSPADIPLP